MFKALRYDVIFVHREAAPLGPAYYEWVIAKLFRKKLIYDFDDAIWLANTSDNNKIAAGLKWHTKVEDICKWATIITCGNEYLREYAAKFNTNAIYLPTTIDMVNVHNVIKDFSTLSNRKLIIGWTGSHSTMHYLDMLLPVFKELEEKHKFELRVISNKEPDFNLKSLKFVPWNKKTEIKDLAQIDIGIMPLTDDPWAKGKCGFKALQYMSLGIPSIVSPVGVNTRIVEHNSTGYVCETNQEWKKTLENLLIEPTPLLEMGKKARTFIQENYSVQSQKQKFLNLFD